MSPYKHIGVTIKPHLQEKEETVRYVIDIVRKTGADVCIDAQTMDGISCVRTFPTMSKDEKIDALLVIGGDGTILRAVRELPDFSIPIVSVNRGSVGFLAEVALNEAATLLPKLLAGEGVIEERSVLHVQAMNGKKILVDSFALNEAAISQGTIARLLDLQTTVNSESLAKFHADGLIVATPTGSTAYSLAAGGPVVHPRLQAMILTPINPHSLTQKPVVIPGSSRVDIDIVHSNDSYSQTHVSLTLDGQVYVELTQNDRVTVTTHSETAKFIRRKEDTFFHTLRSKLKWGEGL